jgi:outer membrane lipoprotein SlyB
METKSGRLHPLIAVAAISVTLASLAAVAVLTGVMPGTRAESASGTQSATQIAATQPSPTAAEAATTAVAPPPAATKETAAVPLEGRVVHRTGTRHRAAETQPAAVPPIAANEPPAAVPAPPPPPACPNCGTIESVRQVVEEGQGTGLGAVAGGVLGGVLGHQIGRGRGNDAATVLGAVGGAVAGHQIEKSQRKSVHYDITVRMDDGGYQTIKSQEQPAWHEGDRVRVVNGALVSAGQTY